MKQNFYICAIMKDEQLYLKEWIEYHLSIGFDRIFLYEDFLSHSHESITNEYEKVELYSMAEVPFCYPNKVGRQIAVYNHFCKTHDEGWCLFTDIDEYLRLEDGLTLETLVEPFNNKVGLCIWWKCYGANNYVNRPNCSVQEAYSDDYRENWNPCWQFKSFVNLSEASKIKGEQTHFVNCHFHKRIVHTDGSKADFRQKINKKYKNHNNCWIDHYISKSWEDYVDRLKRGNITRGLRDLDYFFRLNPSMLPLKEKLTKGLDNNMFPTATFEKKKASEN